MVEGLALLLGLFLAFGIFKNRASYISLQWVIISLLLINGSVLITNEED